VSNLREKTVRVFSDGVPERDYPEGCQLAVLCDRMITTRRSESKASRETPRGSSCYLNVSAAFAGSVPHHHIRGSGFWRGHTSFSVSPSYSRPFFITYRIVFLLWMSSSGLASSTIRSASLPGSSDPRSCSNPIACAPSHVATRSPSRGFMPPAAIAHIAQWQPTPPTSPRHPRPS